MFRLHSSSAVLILVLVFAPRQPQPDQPFSPCNRDGEQQTRFHEALPRAPIRFFLLVCPQRLSKTHEILRTHSNDAAARAVNIGDERERDGHNQRQNQKEELVGFRATRAP